MAIISLILVIAYATTSFSTQNLQDTQEHREATTLAQSQIEYLRSNGGLDTDSKGCFDETGAPANRSATNCRFNSTGAASNCTDGGACYLVDITRDSTYIYTVSITWNGFGNRSNTVALWYQLPPIPTASSSGSGGGSSGPQVEAVIDPGGCGGPLQPACPGAPPLGGQYHYDRSFHNLSLNDPAHILGCTWDWGDGTSTHYTAPSIYCEYDHWTPVKTFTPPAPMPNYPAACLNEPGSSAYRFQYSVTLTIDFDNAPSKTSDPPSTGYLPDCY